MKLAIGLMVLCLCVSFISAKSIKHKTVEKTWGNVDATEFGRESIVIRSGDKVNTHTVTFPPVKIICSSNEFILESLQQTWLDIIFTLFHRFQASIQSLAWNSSIIIHRLKWKLLMEKSATHRSPFNSRLKVII